MIYFLLMLNFYFSMVLLILYCFVIKELKETTELILKETTELMWECIDEDRRRLTKLEEQSNQTDWK